MQLFCKIKMLPWSDWLYREIQKALNTFHVSLTPTQRVKKIMNEASTYSTVQYSTHSQGGSWWWCLLTTYIPCWHSQMMGGYGWHSVSFLTSFSYCVLPSLHQWLFCTMVFKKCSSSPTNHIMWVPSTTYVFSLQIFVPWCNSNYTKFLWAISLLGIMILN